MTRRAVTMLEVLVATAILGAVVIGAYAWLEQDFRFARELVGRETADTLVRNLLERYRHMPPEVMLRLVGEEGEVDPGDLGDATLDRVDPRGSDELEGMGHHRGIRVWRQGGPLGGVGLAGRASWRSVDGDLDQFEFGVGRMQAGGGGQEGGWGPRGRPSGFRRRDEVSNWGTRKSWSIPPGGTGGGGGGQRSGRDGDAGGGSDAGAGDGRGGSGGRSGQATGGSRGGSGGDGSSSGSSRGRRHGTSEVWGGTGLDELIRKAATSATAAGADIDAPPTRIPEVKDDRKWLGRLTGEDGDLARSYREALERLRRRAPDSRESDFIQRTHARAGAGLSRDRVPPGKYEYVVDVLDVRGAKDPRRIGSFLLTGDEGRYRAVLRELGRPARRTFEGDDVLDVRDLTGPKNRAWKFWRTPERIVLVEYPEGFFPSHLVLHDLPAPDPSSKGTTMTRRAVDEAIAQAGLAAAGRAHPSLLQVAASKNGSF